jgi:hypothetical protein
LKSTDIPNACVFAGPTGNILTDMDEVGTMSETGCSINLNGWNDEIMANGRLRPDVLVLAHVVRGTDIQSMLVRYLTSIKFESNGKAATISEVSLSGLLPRLAKAAWSQYMERLKAKEKA